MRAGTVGITMDADRAVTVPEPVRDSISTWLSIHDDQAPGVIEGLYLVGSAALGDWRRGSDIDIVAFTADPATDATTDLLETAHVAARTALDDGHRHTYVDGPRLAWGDVSVPPMPVMRPWTLEGRFHLDGDCFEINPVTWTTLARYGVAVRGPAAGELGVHLDDDELVRFVRQNVDTYWRAVAGQLRDALAEPRRRSFDAGAVEWCALGIARMLVTTVTGEIVSKSAAGEWAAETLPEHADILRRAVALRSRVDPAEEVDRDAIAAVTDLLDDVVARIVDG
jgi:hypothetical protein